MRYAVTKIKAALCSLIRNYEFELENADAAPSPPVGMVFFTENPALLNIKRVQ